MANNAHVDIFIRGAGLAGISLALALIERGYSGQIIIAERQPCPNINKTWCFWGEELIPTYLQPLIAKKWRQWQFSYQAVSFTHNSNNLHAYCCIHAEDFYHYALTTLAKAHNVSIMWDTDCQPCPSAIAGVAARLDDTVITATFGFDNAGQVKRPTGASIGQFFSGAWVLSETPMFDPETAGLMQFMKASRERFEFSYLLPFSPFEALIELTRFSLINENLSHMQADLSSAIEKGSYGPQLMIKQWEQGVIPMDTRMTASPFKHWINIGISGQTVRSASGYAFLPIQHWASKMAKNICLGLPVCHYSGIPSLYHSLDAIFLKVLRKNMGLAPEMFSALAKQLDASSFSRFMTERATLTDIASVIFAMPKRPFIKALLTPHG